MDEPAAGAGAGATLRKEAEAAVMLFRDGRHEEALARVDELAAAHTGSSLVLYAAGLLHHDHARRAKGVADKEVAAHHLTNAEACLTEAKRLVPNCIEISALLARVLFEASKHDAAMDEVYRGIEILSPIDPAENNVMVDEEACASTTKDQRVENSREMARKAFLAMLAGAGAALRKEAEAAVKLERDGRHDEALARVDELAAGHAGSPVVLYAAALVHRDSARRAIEAGDMKVAAQRLKSARVHLTQAKRLVPNCVEISALLARVLFEASKHDAADAEILRAMEIPSPVDPAENNVMYDEDACANTTTDQRVENSREMARKSFRAMRQWMCNNHVPLVINKVLQVELDADDRKGPAQALKTANDLAKRCHYSARAQLFRAYMKLNFARGLDATMDRRPFLERILPNIDQAAELFESSIVLSMFRAKLCFVLGFYDDAYLECVRGFATEEPVDPKLEDVPPGSVNGDECADRLLSINKEFGRLIQRLLWVAKGSWDSMTSEEQDSFLSVRLVELQKYCDDVSENSHWAARTISDALSFVKKTRSWRFWICPYCIGTKLPDTGSLLRHMSSKHPAEKDLLMLQTLLDGNLNHDTSVDDNSSDEITVGQDSEGNYFFCFKKTDQIFERLFIPPSTVTEAEKFTEIRENICNEGTQILEKMKQKLKKCKEGTETKLIKSTSEDKASSKSIDNSDIDTVFPDVVHAPGSEMVLEYMCKYLEGNSISDHETENQKPSGLHKTLVDDENSEGRHRISRTMVYKRVPTQAARIINVDLDGNRVNGVEGSSVDVDAEATMQSMLKKLFTQESVLKKARGNDKRRPCILCFTEDMSGSPKLFSYHGMQEHCKTRHARFLEEHKTVSTCPTCGNKFANSEQYKEHKKMLDDH